MSTILLSQSAILKAAQNIFARHACSPNFIPLEASLGRALGDISRSIAYTITNRCQICNKFCFLI